MVLLMRFYLVAPAVTMKIRAIVRGLRFNKCGEIINE
jgi:hypothetical protein